MQSVADDFENPYAVFAHVFGFFFTSTAKAPSNLPSFFFRTSSFQY
jgi:hypothetical protein